MINLFQSLDDRIVVFGQSCVGKTTFALQLKDHHYHCFDALFDWRGIETLGLSITASFEHIFSLCNQSRFVVDGWHLADAEGKFLPSASVVYVVYANYEQIIKQYRVPVYFFDEHRQMFDRWYRQVDYNKLPKVRYFRNDGIFIETTRRDFTSCLECNP